MKKIILLALYLSIGLSSALYSQNDEPLSDRIENTLKSEEFSVGILLQSIGNFSFDTDDFYGGRRFGIGATRLDLSGVVDKNYDYRLQLDFSGQRSVVNALIGYTHSDKLKIIAGLDKPFLSADLDPSPANTDFIDRARLVGFMLNSREIGVTFLGDIGQFNYRTGIYNGTGKSSENDNNFLYTARVGYTFLIDDNPLEFAITGALNDTEDVSVGNTNFTSSGNRKIYGGYVKYDAGEWFGAAEFLETNFDRPQFGLFDSDTDITLSGFYVTAGNRINDKTELLFRYDVIAQDSFDITSDWFILGWNYQATRLISYQLNFILDITDNDTRAGLGANMQFYF